MSTVPQQTITATATTSVPPGSSPPDGEGLSYFRRPSTIMQFLLVIVPAVIALSVSYIQNGFAQQQQAQEIVQLKSTVKEQGDAYSKMVTDVAVIKTKVETMEGQGKEQSRDLHDIKLMMMRWGNRNPDSFEGGTE